MPALRHEPEQGTKHSGEKASTVQEQVEIILAERRPSRDRPECPPYRDEHHQIENRQQKKKERRGAGSDHRAYRSEPLKARTDLRRREHDADREKHDDGRVAEGEKHSDPDRPLAALHQLAGRIVDRGDVVGVDGVPQPESIGEESRPEQHGIAAQRQDRPGPRAEIGHDQRPVDKDEAAPKPAVETVPAARQSLPHPDPRAHGDRLLADACRLLKANRKARRFPPLRQAGQRPRGAEGPQGAGSFCNAAAGLALTPTFAAATIRPMKAGPRTFELTADLLLRAYSIGVFPMAEDRDANDLFWVEPRERGIFPLEGLSVSRRLAKTVRSDRFAVKVDSDFRGVMLACAEREKTWINGEILRLYQEMFDSGHAHSVEAYEEGALVGGLYGVSLGGAFFGESMFHRARDASKVALVHLFARLRIGGFRLLDTQFLTEHLASLGAISISREAFRVRLAEALAVSADFQAWPAGAPMNGAEALDRALDFGMEVAGLT